MRDVQTKHGQLVSIQRQEELKQREGEIFSCDANRIYDTINEAVTYALNTGSPGDASCYGCMMYLKRVRVEDLDGAV